MAPGHGALPPALLQGAATVTGFGPTDRRRTGESLRTEGESVAFLSQFRNRRETAASAVAELKMKVRRRDSRCYTAALSASQPRESRFRPRATRLFQYL